MICPFLSIGKDKPVKCFEDGCEMFLNQPETELCGCAIYAQTMAISYLEDVIKEAVCSLDNIAHGTSFISDICG